jgi:hypothetical protein
MLVELDFTVRFPAIQWFVAELAASFSGTDSRLDVELVYDPPIVVADPEDGPAGTASIEVTNCFLVLVAVWLHGISPLSRRIGMTSARYDPSTIFIGEFSSLRPIASCCDGTKRTASCR